MNRRHFIASAISIPLVSLQTKPLWAKDSEKYFLDFDNNRMWTKEGGVKYDISLEDARKYWHSHIEKGYFPTEWHPSTVHRFRSKGSEVPFRYSYPITTGN